MSDRAKYLRKPEKIHGFNTLRIISFLIVFSSHTMWTKCNATWGGWGVSAFLIMSGYMMMHNYYLTGRIELLNLRSAFIWMFNKIKPLWILHILLTFICINSTYITYENINKFGVELILDIFMIKEWLPFRNAGMLNGGVSWYLCSVVVCYLIFPLFLYYAEKMYTKKKCLLATLVLLVVQVIIGIIGSQCPSVMRTNNSWWEDNWCHWIVYRFPLSRMIDFFLGCNMAFFNIYSYEIERHSKKHNTPILLTGVVLLCVSSIVITFLYRNIFYVENTSKCWWSYVLINTVPLLLLVIVIGQIKGENNNVIDRFSALTTSSFLIHYVVIKFINQFLDLKEYYRHREVILLTYGLLISFLFAYVYDSILGKK